MGFLSFLFGCGKKHQIEPAVNKNPNPADAGRDLRAMMLTTPPEKTDTKPTSEFPRIYGILMDWPIDNDLIATVFST